MSGARPRVPLGLRVAVRLLPRGVREEVLGDLVEAWSAKGGTHSWLSRAVWTWKQPVAVLFTRASAGGDALALPTTAGLSTDLRIAARSLLRAPTFTLVAVATLAIAIGANTAIFSVVETVLLDPLDFTEPDRLVSIRGTAPGSDMTGEFGLAPEFYLQYRENAADLEDLGYYLEGEQTVQADDHVERLPVSLASPSLFSTLGVRPVLGRLPSEQDDDAQVVVLSHWLWTEWFGRDAEVIGRTVEIAGGPRTVVGVMGPSFGFPHERVAAWLHDLPPEQIRPGGFGWEMVGRLTPDADRATLTAQLDELAARIPERFGGSAEYARILERHRSVVRSLEEELVGEIAGPLWILMGTAGIVLLIACANVANLLLARAEDRRRSFAVRRSLGASRMDLLRAQLIEALVLALGGGIGGVAIAVVGIPLLVRAAPESIPRLAATTVDPTVLAFTSGIVLFAALASGLLPALRFSSPSLEGALGSRMQLGSRATRFMRHALVVAQSAAALVLLVGSGLLVQSFLALSRVDPGYETEGVFTFQMAPVLREHGVTDAPSLARFHYAFMERLAGLPDVESVGLTLMLPLDEGADAMRVVTDRTVATGALEPLVRVTHAGGEYFSAMGIALLAGTDFERNADPTPNPNAIVSRSAAALLWPGEDPLGKRFRPSDADSTAWLTISGVVEDVILDDFRRTEPEPLVYLPLVGHDRASWPVTTPAYVVKSTRAATLAPEIRDLVREIAPEAPVYHMATMSALAARSVARLSFTMLTLGVAAGIAIILGSVGLYGVLSYLVSQRTREIGLRMALGAKASGVRRAIVAQGARVVVLGVLLGGVAAAALTRALDSLLFGVPAVHVPTYAMTAALMIAVALLASYLPARRASAVDPMTALRAD
ncbi:MAG: ABC transporter permease [Gemmatimonadales bacterium]